jgi:hypothetical protein
MPAFDEGGRLAATLADLASLETTHELTLFLVDDGSKIPIDGDAVARSAGAVPVVFARHAVNLGQGAAIETARRLALDPRFAPDPFDAYVTMDADGQHRAADVLALADAIGAGADVALGDRFAGDSNVPRSRAALLGFARAFERIATGLSLSDAHNGLRAFGPRAIERIRIRQNRMAHATELTRWISKDDLSIVEVPVTVRYTDESLAKGQSASGALAILVDLFQGFLFQGRR